MYARRSPKLALSEDRARIPVGETLRDHQPFLLYGQDYQHRLELTRSGRQLTSVTLPEQVAFALGQVTASSLLPPLTELENGYELLNYRVMFRPRLDHEFLTELAMTLRQEAAQLYWEQVDASSYACVIGAGVAACLDITPFEECLYLRYANGLARDLRHAQHAAQLPRSLLFLQTNLHERFDLLLNKARAQVWYWLGTG